MVETRSAAEVDAMREADRGVARALEAVRGHGAPGGSLLEPDEVARTVIAQASARSAFLRHKPAFAPTPFPAVICASVNEVIVHGVPDGYRPRAGDLLSVDCGAYLDGWAADSAISSVVGRVRHAAKGGHDPPPPSEGPRLG
ncbi:M24 family metallopeptidase [Streptosporangium brasiliense]|uniref:Methionine aminopeptidase n=1 Tax=Streptosporangium brasiliense TaxID=47480 RepID=A0ABT9RGG8_9ACTN|nr:M24 family metallopeptidase [Streptosporangium brasiliense]MDP9868381.1 methionine aminopeptidase [Streptosporangium brasiliense]